ncbi:MAG TPA: pyridoxal-phosphate dependent enzyme, partial [Atopobiaceae bacterium]|nr:pyridoxal-phosphate dependent enzyme [Atopobiaceae bacterium]
RFLKEQNAAVKIIAVEPAESPVLSGGAPGAHRIQGIGAGFVPATYDAGVVDEIMTVASDDAIATKQRLARETGLLVGISAGAAVAAAIQLAESGAYAGSTMAVVLPDTGERYLSLEV